MPRKLPGKIPQQFSLLLLATSAWAQTVTLSPQGASALKALTGKVIPHVQLVSVVVCAEVGESVTINAGRIYAAAVQARFAPISPALAIPLIQSTVASNWRNVILEVFQVGSIAAAGLTAGGVIHASAVWTVGLTTGHSIVDYLSDRLRAHVPNAGALVASLLDPEARLDLAEGCKSATILSLYGRGIQSAAVKVDIGRP